LCEYFCCALLREERLQMLKKNDIELWKRVQFWVSDLLDFEDAQERLIIPTEFGVTPFMPPFYFSTMEATYLGRMLMPDTTELGATLSTMLETKAADGATVVSASNDMAPILFVGFEMKWGFQKTDAFKKEQKNWIKQREKELKLINM